MNTSPVKIHCPDNGTFPNSRLPVLFYKKALPVPYLLASKKIRSLFESNGWTNSWDAGIFTYNHYHSLTHEALGIYKGHAMILLGGENGHQITIEKGDMLIIPAGVAHKNLGHERDIGCIGAYPDGRDYDINTGKPGERPGTDENISRLPIPEKDPLLGVHRGVHEIWTAEMNMQSSV